MPDASSVNADLNEQQQNTAPQGAGQQDSATPPELPSDDGAQGGQAGEAPSDLGQAPDGDTITVSVDGAATMATASTTGTSGIATGGMGGGPATGNRPEGQGGPA